MTNPDKLPNRPEWEPHVPQLHRDIVESGQFDNLPQKDFYAPDEIVIARHNGDGYHPIDDGGNLLTIWYDTPEKSAREIVSRQDVRGVAVYGKLAYELRSPTSEVIEITDQGHIVVAPNTRKSPDSHPPFPDSLN